MSGGTLTEKLRKGWHHAQPVLHVGIAIAIAAVITAYAAFVGYGDNVFAAYSNAHCKSHFYNNVATTRDLSMALWVASIFVIASGTVALYHRALSMSIGVDVVLVVGICVIIVSGLLALLVALTGTCKYPTGHDGNGEVRELEVFAVFVVGLGVLQALLHDVVLTDKGYTVLGTTALTSATWLARLMVIVPLTMITSASDADFAKDYIAWSALLTPQCINASLSIDWEDSKHDLYNEVRLGKVDITTQGFESNKRMDNLAIVLCVAVGLEFFIRVVEVVSNYHTNHDHLHPIIRFGIALQWLTDISIAVYTYTLVMANSVAACPELDASNQHIEWLYVAITVFYGLNTLNILLSFSGIQTVRRLVGNILHVFKKQQDIGYKTLPPDSVDAVDDGYTSEMRVRDTAF